MTVFNDMTIFFISDLHLDEKYPNSYTLFANFFNNLPNDTKAVYILGDWFEYWIDDRLDNPFLAEIKHIFKTAANKTAIFFIHGNRDFLIGNHFAKQANIKILPGFYQTNIQGHEVLLTHGDSLTPDKRHQYFSKIIRHPIAYGIANILPINLKLNIAKKLRDISKNRFKTNKDPKIYDICQLTMKNVLQHSTAKILIHGHTHKPNIYNFTIDNKIFTRIVLGSWGDTAQILVFNKDGYKLETISI